MKQLMFKMEKSLFHRMLCVFVTFALMSTMGLPAQTVSARIAPVSSTLNLPIPGTMVTTTPGFVPPLIKGITTHSENPFLFDFIVSTGEENVGGQELAREANKMIKYFLATLTVPEDELWVNLSPYEKDRIIADKLGQTAMGRDERKGLRPSV